MPVGLQAHHYLDSVFAANPNRPPTNIAITPAIQNGVVVRIIPAESKPTPTKNIIPDTAPHNVSFTILYAVEKYGGVYFIFFFI